MASRAATLVKPKPVAKAKPKTAPGKIASKPAAAKSAVTLKSSALKSSALKSSSVAVKPSASKINLAKSGAVKAGVSKAPLTKPKMLKSVPAKASATKLVKPAAVVSKPKASLGEASMAIAGAASFESAAPKPRRRAKGEIRTRIYWAVFNQSLRRVAVFEFDQREEAEKRAAKLAKASGEHHFLQKIKAIVQ